MQKIDLWFILLHFSVIVSIALIIYIAKSNKRDQLNTAFTFVMLCSFIWGIGHIFEVYSRMIIGKTVMLFVYLYLTGVIFIPVAILLMALVFKNGSIKFDWKIKLLFIPQIVSVIVLYTNGLHKLFIVEYHPFNNMVVFGKYFFIHSYVSYFVYLLISISILVYFSARNSGFFSKQSILVILAVVFPFLVNILSTFKVFTLPAYSTPTVFVIAFIMFYIAIIKYKFLKTIPIALQTIVDRMSDAFLVVNEKLEIIDFNKSFTDTFCNIYPVDRTNSLYELTKYEGRRAIYVLITIKHIIEVMKERKPRRFELRIRLNEFSFNRCFEIEVSPLETRSRTPKLLGVNIIFNDITTHKDNIKMIKKQQKELYEQQEVLIQNERLVSLGHLIGGVAHNLKTPIMSIAGQTEGLNDLITEYTDAIYDSQITKEDHKEIAKEMKECCDKIKDYLSYMSDVISAVKSQAVSLNSKDTKSFMLEEIINRVDILMKHELKQFGCTLKIECLADKQIEIKGDSSNLIQVLNNLIINSIHAYKGDKGKIELIIEKSENKIKLSVKDYGCGIRKDAQENLFKKMFTTKGKHGNGIGLYISYSTIVSKFSGEMWYMTKENEGTTFFITIPILSSGV